MALYCDTGDLASFPPPGPPPPKPERGAPWRPPDTSSSTCQRCGKPGTMHLSTPPALRDRLDEAIFAAAFVAAIQHDATPGDAVRSAETLVELHRRARSGT